MASRTGRFLGITVLGDFILSEGVDAVLDRLYQTGVTAVACNPTVTAPAPQGEGSFQPPADAGTSPRVFDRPLFGKRALWVRSGPSFTPNPDHYRESPYRPRTPNDLTHTHGRVIQDFIRKASASGLSVYLQLGAAQPTGLRDEDRGRLPDGSLPQNPMADTASLASPAVRAYNRAYVADLLEAYPEIRGFRIDWPEYPCYTLGETFRDFGPHAERWANEHGFDFEGMRRDVSALWRHLHGGLDNRSLAEFAGPEGGRFFGYWLLTRYPGVLEWLRFKAALSADLLSDWRQAVAEADAHATASVEPVRQSQQNVRQSPGARRELSANAFMPPWTLLTGLDFGAVAEIADSVAPKLYTMHWSQMVDFWGRELLAANPGLDERLLVRALARLMDLDDGTGGRSLADFGYPAPDQPHPIPDPPQRRKVQSVLHIVAGRIPVYPLVHGYGPADDFRRRLRIVAESPADGVWINRYGYLSREKLEIIRETFAG